ncbi:MAG TPA: lipocalin family protein [Chitinophagaceae bacterium]|jgi:hypothetical protein|nr:lipocalin family protein [Chitinophagaceae bacterium]
MSKFLYTIVAGILFLTSCQKEETDGNPDPSTPSVANLSGSYKISKAAAITSGIETDVTAFAFLPCMRDDIYKLNANMTYEVVDAGVQCSPPGNFTGTWSLTNNTTIALDVLSGTIRKFDGKNLEVLATVNGVSAVIYYVKQ